MESQWKVAGTYFEACPCEAACPCNFAGPPTEGHCTALIAWHVDEGKFGDTRLDGLNAAFAVYSPKHMQEGNWKVALYLDERADDAQKNALQSIFSGAAGGHLSALKPFIAEVMGVSSVKIDYRAEGRTRSLKLGDIGAMEIEGISGLDGGDVTIHNPPFTVVPDAPLTVARSKSARYRDHGLQLEVSGKNGFYSPFSYQAA